MDSSVFLEDAAPAPLKPVYVVHGDEDFLKRRVLLKLRQRCFGEGEESLGWSLLTGDQADFGQVRDELSTLGFLSCGSCNRKRQFVYGFARAVSSKPQRGQLVADLAENRLDRR